MDDMNERIVSSSIQREDRENEINLRPKWLEEYILNKGKGDNANE